MQGVSFRARQCAISKANAAETMPACCVCVCACLLCVDECDGSYTTENSW